MFEKVNPSHPDKVADRIAGALVDYAYTQDDNPKIAVEVLIGHNYCHIISETSVHIPNEVVKANIKRICNESLLVDYLECKQDKYLAKNQDGQIRCGDNGIFKGAPITHEQKTLSMIARDIYSVYPYDGKYIYCEDIPALTICQSHAKAEDLQNVHPFAVINPLGYWNGGVNVDTGATNRKLGSDMGDAVTGGGLHGKDLSKADVSVNIYAHLLAQQTGKVVQMHCSIGDEAINGVPYEEIVETAREYIRSVGGFEKLAEWGLI